MSEKVVEYDLKRGKCGIVCINKSKNSERVLFFRKGIYISKEGSSELIYCWREELQTSPINFKMSLYNAADSGNLELVRFLIEKGTDKNQIGENFEDLGQTALIIAAGNGHLHIVQYLVEHGADMEKTCYIGFTPLLKASDCHLEVVRYLLEQGANRDKAVDGWTSLHMAANYGRLDIAKLLMVYGADLNARTDDGQLPIDMDYLNNEEIKQAIRDEPRRRIDEAPGKRCASSSASTQQEEGDNEEQQSEKQPCLVEGAETENGMIAEEDEDSEPSDDEDGN